MPAILGSPLHALRGFGSSSSDDDAGDGPRQHSDHKPMRLGSFDVRGRWSAFPVTPDSYFIPDPGEPPVRIFTRADFMQRWSGKQLHWVGDSVSRYQFYSVIMWLFGCGPYNRSDFIGDPLPVSSSLRNKTCSEVMTGSNNYNYFNWPKMNSRVVAIERATASDATEDGDISLHYQFVAFASDLRRSGARETTPWGRPPAGPSLAKILTDDPSSRIIANVGLWHLGHPRNGSAPRPVYQYAMDGYLRELLQLMDDLDAITNTTTTNATASSRSRSSGGSVAPACQRLVWRAVTPSEWALQDWNSDVSSANRLVAPEWQLRGYRVSWPEHFMAGRPTPPVNASAMALTVDGTHPLPHVLVHSFWDIMHLFDTAPGPACKLA